MYPGGRWEWSVLVSESALDSLEHSHQQVWPINQFLICVSLPPSPAIFYTGKVVSQYPRSCKLAITLPKTPTHPHTQQLMQTRNRPSTGHPRSRRSSSTNPSPRCRLTFDSCPTHNSVYGISTINQPIARRKSPASAVLHESRLPWSGLWMLNRPW